MMSGSSRNLGTAQYAGENGLMASGIDLSGHSARLSRGKHSFQCFQLTVHTWNTEG